jgi:hypothetical protein
MKKISIRDHCLGQSMSSYGAIVERSKVVIKCFLLESNVFLISSNGIAVVVPMSTRSNGSPFVMSICCSSIKFCMILTLSTVEAFVERKSDIRAIFCKFHQALSIILSAVSERKCCSK